MLSTSSGEKGHYAHFVVIGGRLILERMTCLTLLVSSLGALLIPLLVLVLVSQIHVLVTINCLLHLSLL